MAFYYHDWNVKYVQRTSSIVGDLMGRKKPKRVLQTYKFRENYVIARTTPKYDRNAYPIVFQTTPDCLVNLASNVIDKMQLPMVYQWTYDDVVRWIKRYGYPQYMHTFRENLINGRTLLLIDASALSAMNIKNFDHIKHIAFGIRKLFYFEMTKFARSISLPPEYLFELYKLFRVKNGPKYEFMKITNLWERYGIIRRHHCEYNDHWDILEKWLKIQTKKEYSLIGLTRRCHFWGICKQPKEEPAKCKIIPKCQCMPPCDCAWKERDLKKPWRLGILSDDTQKRIETEVDEPKLSWLRKTFPYHCQVPSKLDQGSRLDLRNFRHDSDDDDDW